MPCNREIFGCCGQGVNCCHILIVSNPVGRLLVSFSCLGVKQPSGISSAALVCWYLELEMQIVEHLLDEVERCKNDLSSLWWQEVNLLGSWREREVLVGVIWDWCHNKCWRNVSQWSHPIPAQTSNTAVPIRRDRWVPPQLHWQLSFCRALQTEVPVPGLSLGCTLLTQGILPEEQIPPASGISPVTALAPLSSAFVKREGEGSLVHS